MKKINQKGFTFIEVLATLTILSILCMLIIPSVYKYMTEGKRIYDYEGVAEQFLVSGKSYFSENKKYLPIEDDEASFVYARTLATGNYLSKEVVDSDGNSCMDDSFVAAKKVDGTVKYGSCLICGGKEIAMSDYCRDDGKYKITVIVINGTCKDEGNQSDSKCIYSVDKDSDGNLKVDTLPDSSHSSDIPTAKCSSSGKATIVMNGKTLELGNIGKTMTCKVTYGVDTEGPDGSDDQDEDPIPPDPDDSEDDDSEDPPIGPGTFTVELKVENGTGSGTKSGISEGSDVSFDGIKPNDGYGNPSYSCTNSIKSSLSGTKYTVKSVTEDTVCTIRFSKNNGGTGSRTVTLVAKNKTVKSSDGFAPDQEKNKKYAVVSDGKKSIKSGSSEKFNVNVKWPDDRYRIDKVTCNVKDVYGEYDENWKAGTDSERTDYVTITNNSSGSDDVTCTVYYYPIWVGIEKGAKNGDSVVYGSQSKKYTVVESNDSTSKKIALNGTYGKGPYSNSSSYLESKFLVSNKTLKRDKKNGGLRKFPTGKYVNSASGISKGLTNPKVNYYLSSHTFYNRVDRHRYYETHSGFSYGYSHGGRPELKKLATGCKSDSTFKEGSTSLSNSSIYYSYDEKNGKLTFKDTKCSSKESKYYYSKREKEIRYVKSSGKCGSSSSSVMCVNSHQMYDIRYRNGKLYREAVKSYTPLEQFIGTYQVDYQTCAGTKRKSTTYGSDVSVVTRANNSSSYYYKGGGKSGNYSYTGNYNSITMAGRADTSTYSNNIIDSEYVKGKGWYRHYQFQTYRYDNGDKWCNKVKLYSVSNGSTVSLYYRPYIIVREK